MWAVADRRQSLRRRRVFSRAPRARFLPCAAGALRGTSTPLSSAAGARGPQALLAGQRLRQALFKWVEHGFDRGRTGPPTLESARPPPDVAARGTPQHHRGAERCISRLEETWMPTSAGMTPRQASNEARRCQAVARLIQAMRSIAGSAGPSPRSRAAAAIFRGGAGFARPQPHFPAFRRFACTCDRAAVAHRRSELLQDSEQVVVRVREGG